LNAPGGGGGRPGARREMPEPMASRAGSALPQVASAEPSHPHQGMQRGPQQEGAPKGAGAPLPAATDLGSHRPLREHSGFAVPEREQSAQARGWAPQPKVPPLPADHSAPQPAIGELREPALDGGAPAPVAGVGAPSEVDVEMIQRLIKKLADEVNAVGTTAAVASKAVVPEKAIEDSLHALRHTADAMRTRPAEAQRSKDAPGSKALDHDVDALLNRAERIAGGAASAPAAPAADPHGGTGRGPMAPATRPGRAAPAGAAADRTAPRTAPSHAATPGGRLAEVAEAIAEGRVDVLLEPILGLEDQRAAHYEVSMRLRSRSGGPIQVIGLREELAGTGLLPMLDGVSIRRTSHVAQRLDERGKAGSVFSALSAESLAADNFLTDFADSYHAHKRAAAQLVLTFDQSDVRRFGTQEWATLADMRELGFRFALRAVTDLDMDFDVLRKAGFAFVKLDAGVFLHGLPAPGGHVPVNDICRHLAALGMALIVEHIEDESMLARIFGFGVLFGQGQLFGGARIVKAEVAGATRNAAA